MGEPALVDVDGHDRVRPDETGPHDAAQADAADAEDDDAAPGGSLDHVQDRAHARDDGASGDRGDLRGDAVRDGDDGTLGDDHPLREAGHPEEVVERLAAKAEPGRPVEQSARGRLHPSGGAEHRVTRDACDAPAATGSPHEGHAGSDGDLAARARAERLDDPRALVTQDHREATRDVAQHVVVVAVAHARRLHADGKLACPGSVELHVFDLGAATRAAAGLLRASHSTPESGLVRRHRRAVRVAVHAHAFVSARVPAIHWSDRRSSSRCSGESKDPASCPSASVTTRALPYVRAQTSGWFVPSWSCDTKRDDHPEQAGGGSTARRPDRSRGAARRWRGARDGPRRVPARAGGAWRPPGSSASRSRAPTRACSMSVDAPTWIARTPPPRARNARMLASADAWAVVTGPAAALTMTRSTLRRSTRRSSTSSAISTSWPRLPAIAASRERRGAERMPWVGVPPAA